MSERKNNNVVEFVHDSSDLYFLLGAVSGSLSSLNDLAKREFVLEMERKAALSEGKQKQILNNYIKSLKEVG